ncbi:MAG: maleylpyruvate isomerase family mycothiol-dependent enzyme [Actinomycetota bacterium]|nr:maleylpyruvate isomerase family mycothiol-dependent enzyme [Actinomycetota bacterium]
MTSEPTPAADAGADDPVATKRRLVSLLGQAWASMDGLLSQLGDEQWEADALPGWNVHDVVAHVVGTERQLSGAEPPPALPPEVMGSHVHNDIARMNEAWIVALRRLSHDELRRAFDEITATRLAQLEAMSPDDYEAPSWTPVGPGTYARFMEVRVFDSWMHEQDIRWAVGIPGHESGPVAEQSLTEVTGSLGYIVGKRAAMPEGSAVLIRLTGPIQRDLHVVVDGRARVVDRLPGQPTVSITLDFPLFMRLTGGRVDPATVIGQVELGGDRELARQLATTMAFTI